jgi:hypothetical protein
VDQETFDNLARSIASLASRRRLLAGAGTSLAAVIGSRLSPLGDPASADAKGHAKRQNTSNHQRNGVSAAKKKKKKKNKTTTTTAAPTTTTTTTTTTQAPGTTTTKAPPDASQNCLAAGNQCGTNAAQQGTCRVPATADNQAGFICSNNTAGNTCTSSAQCGVGTSCVFTAGNAGALTCRVVIP